MATCRRKPSKLLNVADPKFEIQMLHDRVMVKVEQETEERRSTAGIVIPATVKMENRLLWGEVTGVGANARSVKVGDKVLFSPEDQPEVEVHGQIYLVMRERDLHAVATPQTDHGTGLYL
ncbi:co-chaperone GroES [Acrocarpospora macrocephala]|uniref:10 kDa chaperonin n=1 Tax=Acrocarpospora macrocephala TaxID=150177 RepID=A0A5M3WX23_9ACTN|nr:10 kDa chaperonin [Acrocarpospora macrocephala]